MSLDREKLGKVLALLSSSHPGEVVAAANRASAMLQAAGMDWQQLAQPPAPTTARDRLVILAQQDRITRLEHEILCLRADVAREKARALLAEARSMAGRVR